MLPIVRRAYGVVLPAWVVALPLAAYAATRVQASTLMHAFAFAVYSIGSLVCHQKPDRSFHLWAAQLPVCARCTGIYSGAAATAVVAQAFRLRGTLRRTAVALAEAVRPADAGTAALEGCATNRTGRTRAWLLASALPTAATLVYEWTTGDTPSNAIRFAAGLPLGAVVSWVVTRSVEGRVN